MGELKPLPEKKSKIKRMKKYTFRLLIFSILIISTLLCGFFSYIYAIKNQNNKHSSISIPAEERISVEIPYGSSTSAIASMLKDKGIINYPFVFKVISKIDGYDGLYRSGMHIVSKKLKYSEIMQILVNNPESIRVTIPEGFTYLELAQRLTNNNLVTKDKLDSATDPINYNYEFLKNIPDRKPRLEGYLFPDTYEFGMKASEKEIINLMLARFDGQFKPEYYERAKKLGMTVDQIITLASIIEREAKVADDKPIIAGVFYNRLRGKYGAPSKLQSDATLQYIYLMRTGQIKKRFTEKDTQMDSAYNTYRISGLPPGPICSPGIESIKAALYPKNTDYCYFVAKSDGTNIYSRTYDEHLKAVKEALGN
jgi:UPF0755 protein